MDTEHKLMSKIKNFCIYFNKQKASTEDNPPLQPCVDKVFRAICSINDERESNETQTKNLRVK